MAISTRKQLFRVNLVFNNEMTRSVFVRAKDQSSAERRALRQNPAAIGTSRSPYPKI